MENTSPSGGGNKGSNPFGDACEFYIVKIRNKLISIFQVDYRALATMRIALAIVLIVDLINRSQNISLFFASGGLIPRTSVLPSILSISDDLIYHFTIIAFALLLAIMLLFGFRTRLVTVLLWIITVSYHLRDSGIHSGQDSVTMLILFWSIFLPIGARWSIDERKNREEPNANSVASFGTIGIMVQLTAIYFFSAIEKLKSHEWWDGSAVYYALNHNIWIRFPAELIRHEIGLSPFMTYSVIIIELLFPFFIFSIFKTRILRIIGVIAALILQFLIAVFLELWLFPWYASILVIPLLPNSFWDYMQKLGTRIHARKRFKVPRRGINVKFHGINQKVAFIGMAIMISSNLSTIKNGSHDIADWQSLTYYSGLYQSWGVYVPPWDYNWQIRIEGIDKHDKTFTIDDWGKTVEWSVMNDMRNAYRTKYYLEYFSNIYVPVSNRKKIDFADWICRTWNAQQLERPIIKIKVTLLTEQIPYPGKLNYSTENILIQKNCN